MQKKTITILKYAGFALAGCCIGAFFAWSAGVTRMKLLERQYRMAVTDTAERAQGETEKESGKEFGKEEVKIIEEVDYPFSAYMEGWQLVLCDRSSAEEVHEYSFRLFDGSGELLQEFSCDLDAEGLVFRFDKLYGFFTDLAVFPADAEETHAEGLMYTWDSGEHRFAERPVVIPWYAETGKASMTFVVVDEQENVETRSVYKISSLQSGELTELRRWTLSRDGDGENTGHLYIWDCLEQVSLYDGQVEWYPTGKLLRDDYYQDILWEEIRYPYEHSVDEEILTAKIKVDENGMRSPEYLTYGSREELLSDCGFQDAAPFYEYYDRFQNLELEIYYDKNEKRGCGLRYKHSFNTELEEIVSSQGFIFEGLGTRQWEDDTFSTLLVGDVDALEYEWVTATQAISKYTEDGKLSSYEVRGITERTEVTWDMGGREDDDTFLSIQWIYRDDGTLYSKHYSHDPMSYMTSGSSQDVHFDSYGRPVYEYGYMTHGSNYFYYIYDDINEGESETPGYVLLCDTDGDYLLCGLFAYR